MLILMIGKVQGAELVMIRFGFPIPITVAALLMVVIMPEAVTREKVSNNKKGGFNFRLF